MKNLPLLISLTFLILIDSLTSQNPDHFKDFKYRLVGPQRGGRVTTVAGTVAEPGTFFMGATGGGVWKTTDYGTSWQNVSDGYFETPSIGAIAIAQNDANVVYVGTGSDGIRSNVIIGKGMYKSLDGGKTWEDIGLKKVGQIGAVKIHPDNYNIVYVAAQGNPFAPNPDRGIYKTTNGGMTWEKVLSVSDKTGFSDVELLPGNPEIVFAAAWKNERKPWSIISGGKANEGGIYKSFDGGKTWKKVEKGLPGELIGKIDIEVCPSDSKIVYALVEAPEEEGGLYRSEDQGRSFKLVSNNNGIRTRPFYYTNVRVDPTNPDIVYVLATGYFKSIDGGKTWTRMRPPHGDNHDMWINPDNSDLFIQSNDGGANVTFNGGKTWSTQHNQPTAELYQVEVDDQHPYWLYAGQQDNYTTIAVPSMAPYGVQDTEMGWMINTGGCETGPAVPKPGDANIVYSNCKGRFSVFDKRTGAEKSYDVGAAFMYGHNPKDLRFRFQRVSPIHVSPHDPGVVYHCSQFVHKTIDEGKSWEIISPDLTAFDKEKQVISGSPITRDITGEEFYSTIYSIRESKLQKGLIWVGANDGPVHVTRDGGINWEKVTPSDLSPGGRVDAVEPSSHQASKAYIAVLRYQLGDFKPYIYKTENYGKKWKLLTDGKNGIPADYPVRVVREDPDREGLLYAGTEFGMFISFDDGEKWMPFQQNLPVTPITDIKVHRKDLVISTMGRSFWILDDISSLHQESFDDLGEENVLLKPRDTYNYQSPSMRRSGYPRPSVKMNYYLKEEVKEGIALEIINAEGEVVQTYLSDESLVAENSESRDMATNFTTFTVNRNLKKTRGLHHFNWYMNHQGAWDKDKKQRYQRGPAVSPGSYTARITIGDQILEQSFEVMMDPRVPEGGTTLEDVKAQEALNLQLVDLLSSARKWAHQLNEEKKSLSKNEEKDERGKQRLEEVTALIKKLETAKGTYMQPMLISQIQYLYGITSGTYQLPGKDTYERFEDLKVALEELKGQDSGARP